MTFLMILSVILLSILMILLSTQNVIRICSETTSITGFWPWIWSTRYWRHVWAGAHSYYLKLLDKLQKWICRTDGPSLAASLDPLGHCQNVSTLTLFYGYYFGRYSFEPAQLIPLSYFRRSSARYSDRLHDFSVTIPRWYKNIYVNSFFPRTARLSKFSV